MCGCLSCAPYWGLGPNTRHVPWLGIKPVTLWFTGQLSIHWDIPARAVSIILSMKIISRNYVWRQLQKYQFCLLSYVILLFWIYFTFISKCYSILMYNFKKQFNNKTKCSNIPILNYAFQQYIHLTVIVYLYANLVV